MQNMSDSREAPGLWVFGCAVPCVLCVVCVVACVPAQLTFAVQQLFGSGGSERRRPAATSSAAAAAAAEWKPQALKATWPPLICMQQLNKNSFNSISASVSVAVALPVWRLLAAIVQGRKQLQLRQQSTQ